MSNIHITGAPEGEERAQGIENISEEVMSDNFPKLVKEKDTQVQEAQRVPKRMNPKRHTPKHILI